MRGSSAAPPSAKAKTRGALLSGLRSGELHKAVDKMEAGRAATVAAAADAYADAPAAITTAHESVIHRRSDAPECISHLRESADPDAEPLALTVDAGEAAGGC